MHTVEKHAMLTEHQKEVLAEYARPNKQPDGPYELRVFIRTNHHSFGGYHWQAHMIFLQPVQNDTPDGQHGPLPATYLETGATVEKAVAFAKEVARYLRDMVKLPPPCTGIRIFHRDSQREYDS